MPKMTRKVMGVIPQMIGKLKYEAYLMKIMLVVKIQAILPSLS
jgi:hypothetical protein